MTTCGTSYHDERGEVQDCTPETPCRSCLVAEVERLRVPEDVKVVLPNNRSVPTAPTVSCIRT